MISEEEVKSMLPSKLMAFLRSKDCGVDHVWAECITSSSGVALWISFLPGASCFSQMTRRWEDAVKWLMYYLVKQRFTRGIVFIQANVLVHRTCGNDNEILLYYVCDSSRLRLLERRRHSLFHPLSRMAVSEMVNHKRIQANVLYFKYLNAAEYPRWLDDDIMLCSFLLRCLAGDWLKLSEVYLLVRKITSGSCVPDDATVERTTGIIRYLLENGLSRVGEVEVLQDGERNERHAFCDSALTKEKLLLVIHEEIQRFSASEARYTTHWLRGTDKSEEFYSAHESESERLQKWFLELIVACSSRGCLETDDGLRLDTNSLRHMRYKSKLKALFARHRYICSFASYSSEETKTGWIKAVTGVVRPFIVRVRIWDERNVMSRENALCIARVSGCIRLDGNNEIKVEYEKGEGKLKVDIVDSPIHETAKNIRLRYKGAETLVMLQADMAAALTRSMGEDTVTRRWHGTRVLA